MPNEPEADRVNMWTDMFESAKSKTYNVKNQCYMPCKHGLGYTRLVGMKNGPAMFGAWVAMIQVLSRQPKPRNGFITEDGTAAGRPLTAEDVATLIRMPVPIVAAMLKACQSDKIHWIIRSKDTTGILEGYNGDTPRIGESVCDGEGKGNGSGNGSGDGMTSGKPKKGGRVVANSDAMIRIGGWFKRRHDTLWSSDESETLKRLSPIPPDELDEMEAYYTGPANGEMDIRRRNLITLLNNWPGELDRARAVPPRQRSIFDDE